MGSFGEQVLGTIGTPYHLLASDDGHHCVAGDTVDWATVAAVAGSDVTVGDSLVISVGQKYLRTGQVLARITASGKLGPYDPAAADGRQLLVRGDAFVVNETVIQQDYGSDHPDLIDGGTIWLERVIQSGVAAHTLALGPTLAEFQAQFPLFTYAR